MSEINRDERATPTLMRAARGVYAQAIRVQLQAIGIDDMPRNGAFVVTRLHFDGPTQEMFAELGVSKQAFSQLIDTLVLRGHIERSPDPEDRRRVVLTLTARGKEAAEAVMRAVDAVDEQLGERISPEQIETMREGLIALAEIKLPGSHMDPDGM
ncbi:MAG TPA: MarR family transcriptional regulator [Solirubrobacteraceae bacterium]|jgi:DNA-binding MarR family transcriptional regulator